MSRQTNINSKIIVSKGSSVENVIYEITYAMNFVIKIEYSFNRNIAISSKTSRVSRIAGKIYVELLVDV
jgi:hypothetical protein